MRSMMKPKTRRFWIASLTCVFLLLVCSSCLTSETAAPGASGSATPNAILPNVVNGFANSVAGANTLEEVALREQEEFFIIQSADEGE